MEPPSDTVKFEQQAARQLANGQPHQALETLAQALVLAPHNPELCNLAGICAATLGHPEQAQQLWEQTIALAPHAQAHFNLGLLHADNNRLSNAEQHYREAIALETDNAPAHYNLAVLLSTTGRPDEAAAAYRNALTADPGNAAAHTNLGALLAAQGQAEEAEQCYRAALSFAPQHVEAHINLGLLLARNQRFTEAEQHYRTAIALAPHSAEAHTNLGLLLEQQGQLDAAEQCQRTALALEPERSAIHSNLANLLVKRHQNAEAEQQYLQAIERSPGDAILHSNFGVLLAALKRDAESEQHFRLAIELSPSYALAHYNLGQLLLSRGHYSEGWEHYEYRYRTGLPDQMPPPTGLNCPQWHGEDLNGKSLLIWPEQGLGDEIQFCRYLPLLHERGARITLVSKAPLKPLMETLKDIDTVCSLDEINPEEIDCDYWSFLMSLPLHCGTTLENIPADLPYLQAPADRVTQWASRLPQRGPRVGLVWQGNSRHPNDEERSLSGLAILAPLCELTGINFISLQHNLREDLNALTTCRPLLLGGELVDFADTAAIVSQLDLLICVDTSSAHLAGALGKPCWVLLPAYKTDWRWMNERCDTPWYPSCMRLFRQQQRGDWTATIEEVKQALVELFS